MAASLKPGRYVIRGAGSGESALGVGPVPLIYPPPDVPVRHLSGPWIERWVVEAVGAGQYTIIAGNGRPNDYGLVNKDGIVFLTAMRQPGTWSIREGEDGKWVIEAPGGDGAATLNDDEFPQVTLASPDMAAAQMWEFMPVEDFG